MHITTGTRWVLGLSLLLTAAGVALAPLPTGVPAGVADNGDFRAFVQPRLAALVAASEEVNAMVAERSRNVLALRAEADRITSLTGELDAYLASHGAPAWAEPLVADYRAGSALLLDAIDAAWIAFRSLDFSAMSAMVPRFAEGTALLTRALEVLDDSAAGPSIVH